MEFTESLKERFALTLKSGLVCAALSLPASALAKSPEVARGDASAPVATAVDPSATAADPTAQPTPQTTAQLAAQITAQPDAQITAQLAAQITSQPADAQITSQPATKPVAQPAEQQKVARLSEHIQSKYQISESKARNIVREAIRSATRHQLDPELILALIAVESTFKERAVSRVGARGLMQVMPRFHPDTIKEIGGSHQLFNPAKNIHAGATVLVTYLNAHSGNLRRALLKYNGSLGTRSSYADRVIQVYRDLQRVTVEG